MGDNTTVNAIKRANRQTIASFKRSDTYYYEDLGIMELTFSVDVKKFGAAIARRLGHRLKYRSNQGISASGKVLASASFLEIYHSSIKMGRRTGEPIKLGVKIVRRNDRVPERRWAMWIQLDEVIIDGDGHEVVSDLDKIIKDIIDKAQDFAAGIPGDQGKRIRAYLDLAEKVGRPNMSFLWHYNKYFVGEWGIANEKVRKEMKKAGAGYPLKGEFTGDGHYMGLDFRTFPIRSLIDLYRNRTMEKHKVEETLIDLDNDIKTSLNYMTRPFGRQQESGGGRGNEEKLKKEFRNHVLKLFKTKNHLYYHFDKNTRDDRSFFEKW